MRLLALLVLLLGITSAVWAALPDTAWLGKQKGLTVQSRTSTRVVYRVKGSGDKIFSEYRTHLASQGWTVIDSVWSGSLRYLRVKRETTTVDVTLQNGKTSGKLTVAVSSQPAHGAIADRVIGDDDVTRTVDSTGGAIAINGNSCEITVRGACSIVRVNGSHNTVYVDAAAASILLRGNDNYLRWRRKRNPAAPIITNLGQYNDVKSY